MSGGKGAKQNFNQAYAALVPHDVTTGNCPLHTLFSVQGDAERINAELRGRAMAEGHQPLCRKWVK
jgi:hypothetical protein